MNDLASSITSDLDLDLNEASGNLLDLLLLLNRRFFNHAEFIKGLPLAPSHVKVIFHLMHCDSLPVSQIAQHLGISKPNMTPIIDKLIKDGFVRRYEDDNDRRIIRVEVTEKARALFRAQRNTVKASLRNKISQLPPDELFTLNSSIITISEILNKLTK